MRTDASRATPDRVVIATSNPGKFREIASILRNRPLRLVALHERSPVTQQLDGRGQQLKAQHPADQEADDAARSLEARTLVVVPVRILVAPYEPVVAKMAVAVVPVGQPDRKGAEPGARQGVGASALKGEVVERLMGEVYQSALEPGY